MTFVSFVLLLWQAVAPQAAPGAAAGLPVQMGYRVSPDTVLIGEPFTFFVKVLAPKGVRFEFPLGPDTTTQNGVRPIEVRGEKIVPKRGVILPSCQNENCHQRKSEGFDAGADAASCQNKNCHQRKSFSHGFR